MGVYDRTHVDCDVCGVELETENGSRAWFYNHTEAIRHADRQGWFRSAGVFCPKCVAKTEKLKNVRSEDVR